MNRRELELEQLGGVGTGPLAECVKYPKPYDPVAVLEAMREREFGFAISYGGGEWATMWYGELMGQQYMDEDRGFQSFVEAVRYLHAQAAAADAEFAKQWPVPE